MFTIPIQAGFRAFFDDNFLYPEVEEQFQEIFRDQFPMFRKMVDYLNHSVSNCIIPGIRDEGSGEQIGSQGKQTRTFSGSLLPARLFEKSVTLNLMHTDYWLSWWIMKEQLTVYLSRKAENKERVFMPAIYLHIMDSFGNIIYEIEFDQIQMREIPPLELNKANNGIQIETFAVVFAYNNFKPKMNIGKTISHTKKEYRY